MATKLFDLNIEEILDNWEVHHAIREVIANALDEQLFTKTETIKIYKDQQGSWHFRDYGRGIKIEDFTLNENAEKLNGPPGIIGKFGVGLKDALATFSRHGAQVLIMSSFGRFMLREAAKHGFDSIITLHVQYDDSPLQMQGTEVVLRGIEDQDVARAKSLFMAFSNEEIIDTTSYGQIIQRKGDNARVYINGVLANEEPNFLFSYNITSLTDAMRKRLNRERLNVGRTTYTDRVKTILRSATNQSVQEMLADQVSMRSTGTQCDEMQWLEVSQLAFNYLHKRRQVAYVTEQDFIRRPDVIDNLRQDGFLPIVVDDTQKEKIDRQIVTGGVRLRTVETYVVDFNQSFQYRFIDISRLTPAEQRVYELTPKLLDLVGLRPNPEPQVKISETMRITVDNTAGVWDKSLKAIIILREQLSSPEAYAGTLLHEAIHSITNLSDITREFESALTKHLGRIAITTLKRSVVGV